MGIGGGDSAQMSYMSSGESAGMMGQQQQSHAHHSDYMPSVMGGGQGRWALHECTLDCDRFPIHTAPA